MGCGASRVREIDTPKHPDARRDSSVIPALPLDFALANTAGSSSTGASTCSRTLLIAAPLPQRSESSQLPAGGAPRVLTSRLKRAGSVGGAPDPAIPLRKHSSRVSWSSTDEVMDGNGRRKVLTSRSTAGPYAGLATQAQQAAQSALRNSMPNLRLEDSQP
eukprot:m51a1_g3653 hypothetical protein (161) ;mRNA; r:211768-212318